MMQTSILRRPVARVRRSRRSLPGLTLIEILLVILIIGMLAGALVVAVMPAKDKAKIDTTKVLLGQVDAAIERYEFDIGHYPKDEEGGLSALLTKPNFEDAKLGDKWAGPYIKGEDVPRDAWNNPLKYEVVAPGSNDAGGKPYKLWSTGPSGTDGNDDNIKNWSDKAPGN